MARARLLKPGFFTSDELAQAPIEARYLFAGLWTVADRRGRLKDRPMRLKAELMPFDDVDVDELLTILHNVGVIVRYRVDGHGYICIPSFPKHQSIHPREAESEIPAPECHAQTTEAPALQGQAQPRQTRGEGLPRASTSTSTSTSASTSVGRITDALLQELRTQFPRYDIDDELSAYRDWKAANGKRHKSEAAGFRNWLRKKREFEPTPMRSMTYGDQLANLKHVQVVYE